MGPRAEDRVELVVVVGGEEHGVVGELRRAPAQGEQQHEAGQRRLHPSQRPQRAGRHRGRQQVAVDVLGVGVRHDDVRGQRLAVREADADGPPPPAVEEDLRHRCPGAHPGASLDRSGEHGVAQPPQATRDVPGAEGLLDVGHGRQRRGGAPRVRAGVGGVAVEEGALVRVAQVVPAQVAQRPPGGDGPQVPASSSLRDQGACPVERGLEERLPGRVPDRPGAPQERGPVGTGAWPESAVPGLFDLRSRRVRHLDPGAVGETVRADGIDRDQRQLRVERARRSPGRGPGRRRAG